MEWFRHYWDYCKSKVVEIGSSWMRTCHLHYELVHSVFGCLQSA